MHGTDERSTVHVATETYLIASGLIAVLCALFVRNGIWGALTARFPHLQLFPIRRRLRVMRDEST